MVNSGGFAFTHRLNWGPIVPGKGVLRKECIPATITLYVANTLQI